MGLAADVVAVVLATMLAVSAVLKIERNERSVQVVHELANVPLAAFPALAAVELACAAGVVVGIWSTPIGIAASAAAVGYFAAAAAAHLIAGHVAAVTNPLPPAILALIALALRVATA